MRSSVFYILKMPLLSLGNFEEQKGQKNVPRVSGGQNCFL